MPRPFRCRRIEQLPVYRSFSPDDITATESVQMTVDEFEALRLLDDEGLTQEACASRMNIARTTVTAIYDSARKKVASALVHGKRLLIAGGCCEYRPVEIDRNIMKKGSNTMRIAVTYENGEVFQHFGHSEQFKLYDVENGKIVGEQVGLHPLIALMAIVVGTRLFGGIGLFILPITCALISGLHRQGKIRLFRDKDSAPADGGAEPTVPPESGDTTET